LLRQKQCLDLAQKTDMMFVIGARHSANTRTLAAIARTYCPNVWQIENSKDLQQDHIARHLRCGANKKIGIIAGTSTPAVTVADVTKQVKNLIMEADTNGE
ncbi:MAG: bifunctional 4-hydroxy-3-methylbut-2-enyl diphosphate reductase/30S ribosomal protein S1, partial [candidate division WOR-3 bacterium]|nr:bifunctional 4-hydroxy-3-methylbut-2-enyl diphosphate reductase/30S ribosomal protein S1 [candidate division WOR-3 bacterium]